MKTKIFPLYDDTKDVLRIAHTANYSRLTIDVNDSSIGVVGSREDLKTGVSYDIADGNMLTVKLLNKYFIAHQLQVLVNGEAVENSDTHPEVQFKWVFWVATLPFMATLMSNIDLLALRESVPEIILSINVIILAIFYRYRSVTPLLGIILLHTYQVFTQLIIYPSITEYNGDIFGYFLFRWLAQTLIWLLPTLYLLYEGIGIIKNLEAVRRNEE